ncbi:MAG: pentapeptide repeat-containing protein, partial [Pseudomonadota bacterium]
MANPDHVAKLLEGVHAWNQWRRENPDIRPDLSRDDETPSLRQAFVDAGIITELQRIPLTGADLVAANLMVADLTRADLEGADLTRADLTRADLEGADLRGADLTRADLEGANLRGANLVAADLVGANLVGADLRGAGVKSVNSGVNTHIVGTPEFTDLSVARFLSQNQLD